MSSSGLLGPGRVLQSLLQQALQQCLHPCEVENCCTHPRDRMDILLKLDGVSRGSYLYQTMHAVVIMIDQTFRIEHVAPPDVFAKNVCIVGATNRPRCSSLASTASNRPINYSFFWPNITMLSTQTKHSRPARGARPSLSLEVYCCIENSFRPPEGFQGGHDLRRWAQWNLLVALPSYLAFKVHGHQLTTWPVLSCSASVQRFILFWHEWRGHQTPP